ncbi:polymorphic toxin type 44 domain-containing protein [Hymenobacter norwichensis]|uniref:polymorphic toxin type 44 domain-containing protein n=1 Tax=Hymenobacter norwichensis TaxID=223903 RepID=UPI000423E39C|nr:polymorphic toxin type 44 domain-containing protein [Hymenobacter norwichensis]
MALLESKSAATSAWAAVAHAGNAVPAMAPPASGLATWAQQGAAERQQQSTLGWFDVEFVNFSSDNYRFLNITEGDLRTGLRHRQWAVGRLVDSFGVVWEEFRFADPVNDVKLLKRSMARWLRPVTYAEIAKMLSDAGVFAIRNKAHYNKNRYDYIWKEGQAGGQLDFSMRHLKNLVKPNMNANSEGELVPFLFYVAGAAHNYFNFGNFLYGAAGATLGLKVAELTAGAQANSLLHSDTNGYDPQLDSADDQFSIVAGYEYAQQHNFAQRTTPWNQPQWGQPRAW